MTIINGSWFIINERKPGGFHVTPTSKHPNSWGIFTQEKTHPKHLRRYDWMPERGGPLLFISGVITPVDGRKKNEFHWEEITPIIAVITLPRASMTSIFEGQFSQNKADMGWSAGAQNHAMDDSLFLAVFRWRIATLEIAQEHLFVTEALEEKWRFSERGFFSLIYSFFGGAIKL